MATDTQSLGVIGLISGGKDSMFSLLHCLLNNHRVVALANLYPPPNPSLADEAEDLNSYMYQTAGHGLIHHYAAALGLPLYRQEIFGTAKNQSKDYNQQDEDETESLIPLLKKVMAIHPTANAVCSGAILSTYQRTRIESVARRLNLIPVNYLWQYPSLPPPSPGRLLDDMVAVGFDVRIAKVASGGLDEDLLWCNLMDPAVRRKVERSVARFGGSILGEGGEFETVVVEGPVGLWLGRIEVQNHEKYVGKGRGGEAWIAFRDGAGKVAMKDAETPTTCQSFKGLVRRIGLWDKEFETLIGGSVPHEKLSVAKAQGLQSTNVSKTWEPKPVVLKNGSILTLSNITATSGGICANEQMMVINSTLLDNLQYYPHCDANNIIFTTILLRSMADFAAVNDVYGRLFTYPNPPARVTVACGGFLPERVKLMVSFIVDLRPRTAKEGLHVQSRSYWAPANIGPYSQAMSIPLDQGKGHSIVYVAGQIPLVPASMETLHNISGKAGHLLFFERTCLALQHLWRIGRAMDVGWWTGAVAFIAGHGRMPDKARIAWKVWKAVHSRGLWERDEEEGDGLDTWDRRYGGMGSLAQSTAEGHYLPDFPRARNSGFSDVPGFFAVQVDELPRGCDIEWQSLGIAYPDSASPDLQNVASYIGIRSEQGLRTELLTLSKGVRPFQKLEATVYTPRASSVCDLDVCIVPCTAVWGSEGTELAGGIVVQHYGDFEEQNI